MATKIPLMNPHIPATRKKFRIPGLDYLRAFASIFVVILHGEGIPINNHNHIHKIGFNFNLLDFVNFYMLLTAVPVFFLVSTFLYAQRETDSQYTKKRIIKLLSLLIFWSLMLQGFNNLSSVGSLRGLISWFLTGGESLLFFFVSLIIVTVLSYLIKSWSSKYVLFILLILYIPLLIMPYLQQYLNIKLCYFYNPINFLCYAPLGILVSRYWGFLKSYRSFSIFFLCLLFPAAIFFEFGTLSHFDSILDTSFFAPPAYTRPSLPFISLLYLLLVSNITSEPNRVIKYMSSRSLGLYVMHPFLEKVL